LAVFALVLLVGAGAYFLIHRPSSSSNTAGTQATLTTTTRATKTTAKQSANLEKKKKSKRKAPVEGVNALDAALVAHPLVVVSVYARNVYTDTQAMQEARAGAARAGAGFVAFNVFNEKVARQLTTLLNDDTTSNPEVLFFKRGRTLVFSLQGFADSQVVAQAARNVYPYTEPWVGDANRICKRFSTSLQTAQTAAKSADLTTPAGRKAAATALEKAANLVDRETRSLSAIRANISSARNLTQLVANLQQIATNWRSEAAALRRNDLTGAQTIDQANVKLTATASSLAANLQIATCAS
jgi:hypothetical protein